MRRYTADVVGRGADTIVLGCTHYSFVADQIRAGLEGLFTRMPAGWGGFSALGLPNQLEGLHLAERFLTHLAESLDRAQIGQMVTVLQACHRAYSELDATMVEINPLVVTGAGNLVALDAKMSFDTNALYRRPEVAALRDPSQEDPREAAAAEKGPGNPLSDEGIEPLDPWYVLDFKRPGVQNGVFRKLKQGKYDSEARLDMHRMSASTAALLIS
mgnify:CR=1 FL=1